MNKKAKEILRKKNNNQKKGKFEWHMVHSYTTPLTAIEYKIPLTTVYADVIGVQNQNDSQKLNKSQWKQTRDSKFIINDL